MILMHLVAKNEQEDDLDAPKKSFLRMREKKMKIKKHTLKAPTINLSSLAINYSCIANHQYLFIRGIFIKTFFKIFVYLLFCLFSSFTRVKILRNSSYICHLVVMYRLRYFRWRKVAFLLFHE